MKVDFHGRDLDSPHWQEMRSVYNFYGNTGIGCWKTHSYCIWFAILNAMWARYTFISANLPQHCEPHPNVLCCNCPVGQASIATNTSRTWAKVKWPCRLPRWAEENHRIHRYIAHGLGWMQLETTDMDRKPRRRKRKKGKLRGANIQKNWKFSWKNCGSGSAKILQSSCVFCLIFRRNSLQRIMGMGEDGGSSPLSPLLQELDFVGSCSAWRLPLELKLELGVTAIPELAAVAFFISSARTSLTPHGGSGWWKSSFARIAGCSIA